MLTHLPEEMDLTAKPKYFVLGREDADRVILSVVWETPERVYGFVNKSTQKNSIGKPWTLKRAQLATLLLMEAFGRRWELTLQPS